MKSFEGSKSKLDFLESSERLVSTQLKQHFGCV